MVASLADMVSTSALMARYQRVLNGHGRDVGAHGCVHGAHGCVLGVHGCVVSRSWLRPWRSWSRPLVHLALMVASLSRMLPSSTQMLTSLVHIVVFWSRPWSLMVASMVAWLGPWREWFRSSCIRTCASPQTVVICTGWYEGSTFKEPVLCVLVGLSRLCCHDWSVAYRFALDLCLWWLLWIVSRYYCSGFSTDKYCVVRVYLLHGNGTNGRSFE